MQLSANYWRTSRTPPQKRLKELMRTRTLGLTLVIEVYSIFPLYLLVASSLGSMGIVFLPLRLSLKDDFSLLFLLALLFSPYVAVRLLRLHHNRAGTK